MFKRFGLSEKCTVQRFPRSNMAMLPALGSSRRGAPSFGPQLSEASLCDVLRGHSGGENALQTTASMQGRSPESRLLRAMSGESHPDAEDPLLNPCSLQLGVEGSDAGRTALGSKMCRSFSVAAPATRHCRPEAIAWYRLRWYLTGMQLGRLWHATSAIAASPCNSGSQEWLVELEHHHCSFSAHGQEWVTTDAPKAARCQLPWQAELPFFVAELPQGKRLGNLIAVCTQIGAWPVFGGLSKIVGWPGVWGSASMPRCSFHLLSGNIAPIFYKALTRRRPGNLVCAIGFFQVVGARTLLTLYYFTLRLPACCSTHGARHKL